MKRSTRTIHSLQPSREGMMTFVYLQYLGTHYFELLIVGDIPVIVNIPNVVIK